MKQNVLFTVILLSLVGLLSNVQAQTIFSAVSPSYHTLYYKVANRDVPQVEVCNPTDLGDWWGNGWNNYSTPYGRITIPATVSWHDTTWSVVRIGYCAFASCTGIQRITLPDGIDSIKGYGFFNTQIDTVNIPSSVVYIGNSNFQSPRLHHVILPAGLMYFDKWEQSGDSIMDFTIEDGNPYYRTIDGCLVRWTNNLVELIAYPRGRNHGVVEFPEGVTKIDWDAAVSGHKLILPSTMRYVHEGALSFDTLVFRGVMPPQKVGDSYLSTIQRIELPCGATMRYYTTSWGQYSNLFVTSNYLLQENYQQTITYGESYIWDNLTLTQRGTYEDTLQSVLEGCDSVHRVLTLNVVQIYRSDVLLTEGMSVDFHGIVVNRPGIYEVMVPGDGDFDSLFVLRASAEVNATVTTVQLGGVWDGESIELPAMQSQVFVRGEDSINITNIHQVYYGVKNVTINEGENYNGRTLAGVYQDTLYFADYDSIIRSRVSMNVNRPMDNCMVQLGGNQGGIYMADGQAYYGDNMAVQVYPGESKRLAHAPYLLGSNMVVNGDFELDDSYPYVGDYVTDDGDGYGSRTYGIQGGNGVDGSRCMWFGGSSLPDQALFRITIPTMVGYTYRFSYSALATIYSMPFFAVKVNGQQIDNNDIVPQENEWITFSHDIVATSGNTLVELVDLNTEWNGNDFLIDNLSLICLTAPATDTITITNTHGLVLDTVDVTIAEGQNYLGHILAGVYNDTIIGTDADSIIHSRVSMIVNRPMDNCMVQLGGNIDGYFFGDLSRVGQLSDDISLQVLPGQNKQVIFTAVNSVNDNRGIPSSTNFFFGNGSNLIPNGDFEHGNTGFSTDYTYTNDCNYAGCGNETYSIQQGFGVDGSYGMGVDGAVVDKLLYEVTIPNAPGLICKFSYMARTENHPSPYFAVLVNGVQIDSIDYVPNNNDWVTFEHIFTSGSSSIVLQLYNRNLEGGGNDFFMDNFRLEGMLMEGVAVDTITITNTHGLVHDTIDVTINEGQSYRGYMLAGVYQDTIIGVDADSIIHSRVSMNVNRPMDNCMVQLGGNTKGYYLIENNLYPASTNLQTQVLPSESRQVMFSTTFTGMNLIENGDFEQGNTGFSNDYAYVECGQPFCGYAWYNIMQGYGVDGSYGMAVDGAGSDHDLLKYEITLPNIANSTYKFSYMVKNSRYWNDENPPYIAIKVNGVQVGDMDYVPLEETWVTYEHTFTTDGGNIIIQLQDFNSDSYGNNFFVDNVRLEYLSQDAIDVDTITITNMHGLVIDTVDVTIAEGQSYRGYALAGVYQDTIIGSTTDSIVRSRVSMTINRPMDNCEVLLVGDVIGNWIIDNTFVSNKDTIMIPVIPGESRQLSFSKARSADNLITNGNFEQGNTGFTSTYSYCPDMGECGNTKYRIAEENSNHFLYLENGYGDTYRLPFYSNIVDVIPNTYYLLTYKGGKWNCRQAINDIYINDLQIAQDTFYLKEVYNGWIDQLIDFSHLIYSGDTTSLTIKMVQKVLDDSFPFALDDISLIPVNITDTVTITNMHGLMRDTVDVTIAEGESYHGHTLAGVYMDTIIGVATDSIVYARVSMNINHTFGAGGATLVTNLEGRVWKGQDNKVLSTQSTLTVQVNPATEQRYVLTSLANGSNMQPNGDFEQWQNNWSSEYAWGETPFQGGHYVTLCDTCGRTGRGLSVKGSMMSDRAFYQSEWMNLVEGHRYSFSYWTKSHSVGQPAELAIKVNDQQYEWQLPETDILTETEWTRHEHIFTARRTYATLMRIFDLNTSQNGNEFFLDDVSLVDLTEDSMARRDTVAVNNIHQLRYATVDTAISEGENYHGYTVADIYRDTVVMADYDSITTARVSYVLNTTGEGITTLGHSQPGEWLDLDNNRIYTDSTVSVYPTEVRRFGLLTLAQDTNLIVNGDFEQDTVGFTSHYSYRPEPYPFSDDNTYYVGSYRISQDPNNHFLHCHNYWYPRQGAYYSTTVSVAPNTWYRFSYKAGIESNTNNGNIIEVNERRVAIDTFAHRSANNWTGRMFDYTHVIYSGDTTMLTIVMDQRLENIFEFVIDDITLTPLTISDTITVTNRHQLVYATIDTTINEGESYNGYTLPGLYVDTTYLIDYDSITTSRVSMVINSLDGEVQLESNQLGWWIALSDSTVLATDSVVVPPMQSRQYVFDGLAVEGNVLVNGDFEQGLTGFTSQYNYSEGCISCGPNNYAVVSGYGVNGSNCFSFDGSETYGPVLYEQTVPAVAGAAYRFSYMATTNGQDNSSPAYFEVLINGNAIGPWDYITTNSPSWTSFEHTFVANGHSLTLQIIDRNTDGSGNDCLIDEMVLESIGGYSNGTTYDTITITNRHQLVYDTTRTDICQGGVYTVDSIDYANAGTYTLNTRYYIDSTVYPTLILGVHNNYYPQLTHAICEGESYAFGGNTLTVTGTYVDPQTTIWGCDSTTTLNLTVHAHTASQQIEDVCDSYLWHSTVYTASTTVIDTIDNVHGCDSVCTLNLTVRYSTTGDSTATACDLFNWYGQTYSASGMPTHLLTNVAGCDSTLTLNLTVNYSTSGSETFTVCDSMTWHDALYTASGTYQDVMTNSVNCDSTVTLYLTVNSTYQHTDAVFACDNQLPYLYHEQPLATAGDHTVQFQSMAGCDSTVTVTLTVGATYQHTDQLTLCQSGMPYSYGNQTFYENDTTGIYTIPFSTVEGCDSIINLDLTIHQSEATEIYVVTVQGTNNMVLWNKDAAVDHYNIYRESSTSGIYTLAAVVPYSEPSIWVDQESDNRVHAYRYRMTSVDSCGTESEQSPIHRTMHLTISQGINGSWNLVWTEYQGTTYSTYRIYRGSSYNDMTMIGEIPSDNTTYTDYSAPEGYVYYQIVVLLGSGSKDGSDGTIRSNVATNNQTGIGVAEDMNIPVRIASQNGSIVVETLIGEQVQVFDVVGRRLYNTISTGNDLFEMSSSGVYMVKVGTYPARRVVVTK